VRLGALTVIQGADMERRVIPPPRGAWSRRSEAWARGDLLCFTVYDDDAAGEALA